MGDRSARHAVIVNNVLELVDALADASTRRIVVAPGRYTLNASLRVSRSVEIEAEMPGAMLIDAGGSAWRALIIDPENASDIITLSDLNITGGYVIGHGGGVKVQSGMVTLSGCNVYSNSASDGGGVSVHGGDVTLRNCAISTNSANDGGGVLISGGTAALNDCSVHTNQAYQGVGGGIFMLNGTASLSDSQVFSNSADYDGGGVRIDGGAMTISNCNIRSNRADQYGYGGLGPNVYLDVGGSAIASPCSPTFVGTYGNLQYTCPPPAPPLAPPRHNYALLVGLGTVGSLALLCAVGAMARCVFIKFCRAKAEDTVVLDIPRGQERALVVQDSAPALKGDL